MFFFCGKESGKLIKHRPLYIYQKEISEYSFILHAGVQNLSRCYFHESTLADRDESIPLFDAERFFGSSKVKAVYPIETNTNGINFMPHNKRRAIYPSIQSSWHQGSLNLDLNLDAFYHFQNHVQVHSKSRQKPRAGYSLWAFDTVRKRFSQDKKMSLVSVSKKKSEPCDGSRSFRTPRKAC